MSTASIADFLANGIPQGGARPNRFRVVFTFPAGVFLPNESARKMSYTCKATQAPGHTVGVTEVPYMGRVAKVAGDETIDDWTTTILIDNDYVARDTFENWKQFVINTSTNVGKNEPISYMGRADVEHLDRAGNVIKRFGIEKIWPTVVGPVQLGWDQNNSVSEFEATFAVNDLSYNQK